MKTNIFDELELPQELCEALSREAMRQGKPVKQLIRERLLALADKIVGPPDTVPSTRAA